MLTAFAVFDNRQVAVTGAVEMGGLHVSVAGGEDKPEGRAPRFRRCD